MCIRDSLVERAALLEHKGLRLLLLSHQVATAGNVVAPPASMAVARIRSSPSKSGPFGFFRTANSIWWIRRTNNSPNASDDKLTWSH
eukprot:2795503-Lingulodinium_polyedra.AAC.1